MALKTRRPTVGNERDPVLTGYVDDPDDILRGRDLDDDGVGRAGVVRVFRRVIELEGVFVRPHAVLARKSKSELFGRPFDVVGAVIRGCDWDGGIGRRKPDFRTERRIDSIVPLVNVSAGIVRACWP